MPKLPDNLYDLLRYYNRYSRKRFSVAAAVINLILLSTITLGAVFLLTSELAHQERA